MDEENSCCMTGFVNLGRTCYINASLQVLFNNPKFVNWLKTVTHRCEEESCLLCMTISLMSEYFSSRNAVRPRRIYDYMLRYHNKYFSSGREEDAHEFLNIFLQDLNASYLNAYENLDLTTPQMTIFGGQIKTNLTCTSCESTSTSTHQFTEMTVSIQNVQTLFGAVQDFLMDTVVEDCDCDNCKTKVKKNEKKIVEQLPPVLLIHVSRFVQLPTKKDEIPKFIKNQKEIKVPRIFDASIFGQTEQFQGKIYELIGYITHHGQNLEIGHYTATVKGTQGRYIKWNDQTQSIVTVSDLFNSKDYILFFQLKDKSSLTLPSLTHHQQQQQQQLQQQQFSPTPEQSSNTPQQSSPSHNECNPLCEKHCPKKPTEPQWINVEGEEYNVFNKPSVVPGSNLEKFIMALEQIMVETMKYKLYMKSFGKNDIVMIKEEEGEKKFTVYVVVCPECQYGHFGWSGQDFCDTVKDKFRKIKKGEPECTSLPDHVAEKGHNLLDGAFSYELFKSDSKKVADKVKGMLRKLLKNVIANKRESPTLASRSLYSLICKLPFRPRSYVDYSSIVADDDFLDFKSAPVGIRNVMSEAKRRRKSKKPRKKRVKSELSKDKNGRFKCSQCPYTSKFPSHVFKHINCVHLKLKNFQCTQCSYSSYYKSNYDRHTKSHSGEKSFKCTQCSYSTVQKSNLDLHIKRHNGEKSFKCNLCYYICARKEHLEVHIRSHTGEKPFQCKNVGCTYTSTTKTHITRHQKNCPH